MSLLNHIYSCLRIVCRCFAGATSDGGSFIPLWATWDVVVRRCSRSDVQVTSCALVSWPQANAAIVCVNWVEECMQLAAKVQALVILEALRERLSCGWGGTSSRLLVWSVSHASTYPDVLLCCRHQNSFQNSGPGPKAIRWTWTESTDGFACPCHKSMKEKRLSEPRIHRIIYFGSVMQLRPA